MANQILKQQVRTELLMISFLLYSSQKQESYLRILKPTNVQKMNMKKKNNKNIKKSQRTFYQKQEQKMPTKTLSS